jgi:DNA-binding transcriptional ArsR family regulator
MDALEVLAHPVRLRIVHAMRGGRVLTTAALAALVPDVSQAMIYRHVGVLSDAGILEVAEERRVRGAVERVYRLRPDRASIDPGTASSLSADDHRQGFAIAMATLIAEFTAYLDREESDVSADPIGYQQHALWLNPAELVSLVSELRAAILPRLTIPQAPDRARYLLSPILFPSEEPIRHRDG